MEGNEMVLSKVGKSLLDVAKRSPSLFQIYAPIMSIHYTGIIHASPVPNGKQLFISESPKRERRQGERKRDS